MKNSYIKRLPLPGGQKFINVNIRIGTIEDAVFWHQFVQPHVPGERLDAKWNLPAVIRYWSAVESARGRAVSVCCVDLPSSTFPGKAVPLAIVLLSEGYRSLDGSSEDSVFLWYFTSAPSAALRQLGYTHRKPQMLTEAVIDAVIQRSHELGYDGRVGLHADPDGGDKLFLLYRDGVKMRPLVAAKLTLARKLTTGNDGRFFWADAKLAQSLSNSLNYLR